MAEEETSQRFKENAAYLKTILEEVVSNGIYTINLQCPGVRASVNIFRQAGNRFRLTAGLTEVTAVK